MLDGPGRLEQEQALGGRRLDDPPAQGLAGQDVVVDLRAVAAQGQPEARSCPPPRRGRPPSCSPALVRTGSTWLRKLQGSSRSKSSTEIVARATRPLDRRRERGQAVADGRHRAVGRRRSPTRRVVDGEHRLGRPVADPGVAVADLDEEPLRGPAGRRAGPRRAGAGSRPRSPSPSPSPSRSRGRPGPGRARIGDEPCRVNLENGRGLQTPRERQRDRSHRSYVSGPVAARERESTSQKVSRPVDRAGGSAQSEDESSQGRRGGGSDGSETGRGEAVRGRQLEDRLGAGLPGSRRDRPVRGGGLLRPCSSPWAGRTDGRHIGGGCPRVSRPLHGRPGIAPGSRPAWADVM